MHQLITVAKQIIGQNEINAVDARELHCFLGSKKDFSDWIKAKVVSNPFFQENQDFCLLPQSVEQKGRGGHNRTDYLLSIDTAKKVAMAEQTERGNEARNYFLECERVANQPKPVDPMSYLNDPATMRTILLSYTEKVLVLEEEKKVLTPKAKALDLISTADGLNCITDTAKILQMRPKDLFSTMHSQRWIYRRIGGKGWVAYQDKIQQGLLNHKVTTVTDVHTGKEKIIEQVLVTPKGITKLTGMVQQAN